MVSALNPEAWDDENHPLFDTAEVTATTAPD
jgi:hypothetical protein